MNDKCPLISVAIPAYKKTYLAQAIESILNQTYSNIELIVVNDQSPEDLTTIVRSFKDDRIRYYINADNLGAANPAANWNKCLSLARGEFFVLLCDDDLYEPTLIERWVALAQRYPEVDVFRSRANIIDRNGTEVDRYASAPEWESMSDYMWHVFKDYRYQTISEFMLRRKKIDALGGYSSLPLAWYADYLSIFRFSATGGIASISDCLVHFRQSGLNISSKDDQNADLKMLAAKMYKNEVRALLKQYDAAHYNMMTILLNNRVNIHSKWALERASRRMLYKIFRAKSYYGIHTKMLWRAFWHHKSIK